MIGFSLLPTADLAVWIILKASVVVAVVYALTVVARHRCAALRACLWAMSMGLLLGAPFAAMWLPPLPVVPIAVETVDPLVVEAPVATATTSPAPLPRTDYLAWLGSIWLLGVVLLISRQLSSGFAVGALCRRAQPVSTRIQRIARGAAAAVGYRRAIDVRIADVPAPCLYGVRRPITLLPPAAAEWDVGRLRRALLHELAHARRHDYLTYVVSRLACAFYWPNPLVWWGARRASAECELACDDLVLAHAGQRAHYAEDLLQLARAMRPGLGAAVSMAPGPHLVSRVRAILTDRDRRPLSRAGRVTALALVTIGTVPVLFAGLRAVVDEQDLSAILVQLRGGDLSERQQAAWRLGEMEARRAVPELVGRLGDSAPEVRGVAAWALGEIKDRRAIAPLTKLLDDGDPCVVDMAVRALGECEAAGAVPRISGFLTCDDPRLGAAAAFALGEIGTPEAVDELRVQLRESVSADVQAAALRALGERRAASAEILAHLASADSSVRTEAVRALGRIGDDRAVGPLLPMLRDPEAIVRDTTVWALDEIHARR